MTSTTYPLDEAGAYIFGPQNLRSLHRICSDHTGADVTIEFKFKDGFTLTHTDIDELMENDFCRSTLIDSFQFSSYGTVGEDQRYITLLSERRGEKGKINSRISGTQGSVTATKFQLDTEIRSATSTYGWLYRIPEGFWWLFIALSSGSLFSTFGIDWIIIGEDDIPLSLRINAFSVAAAGGLFLLPAASRFRRWLAPPFIVAIARGSKLAEDKQDLRKRSLWLLLALGAATIVTSLKSLL